MSIKVSQAFSRTSANPVDETMALTKAQMLTVNDNLMPAYYFTICQDDGEIYLYDKSTTASASTGKFKKFEGGGGGGGGTGLIVNGTLTAAGWNTTTRQQTLTFADYTADMGGVIGVPTSATSAQKEAYAEAVINVVAQSGNQFTFEADTVPSIDLPVTLYAGGGSGGSGASLPAGGTTGQALVKKSNADQDVEWGDVSGEQIQYDTMPTASATNLGQIVQYIGTTDANYTNGLFYECVSDGQATPTYSWAQKDVQTYPEVDLTNVFASGFPIASVIGDTKIYAPYEHQIGWLQEYVSGVLKKKPVYEIRVDGTTPSSTGTFYTMPSDTENVISLYWKLSTSDGNILFGASNYGSYFNFFYKVNAKTIHFEVITTSASFAVNRPASVTINYTKTTDTWQDA